MTIRASHKAPTLSGAHDFLITEMRVWPTARPEEARYIEVPEQTIKLNAIARSALDSALLRKLEEMAI